MPSILRRRLYHRYVPPPGAILDTTHARALGLTDYWLFNRGGGSAVPSLTNRDNAVLQSGAYQGGPGGAGLVLNGTSDYVNISDSTRLNPDTDNTVVVRFRLSSIAARDNTLFVLGCDAGGPGWSQMLYLDSSGIPIFGIVDSGIGLVSATGGTALSAGVEYELMGVRLNTSMYLYVNGVQAAFNNGGLAGAPRHANDSQIGNLAPYTNNAAGTFYYVAYWKGRAFSAAEALAQYNGPYAMLRPPAPHRAALLPPGAVQLLYPTSDVSNAGNWTNESGATSPLYPSIGETTENDATYIIGPQAVGTYTCEVAIHATPTETDPNVSTGYIVHFAYKKYLAASRRVDLSIAVVQGTTIIHTESRTDISGASVILDSVTLTGPEADAITDHTDLRLRLTQVSY